MQPGHGGCDLLTEQELNAALRKKAKGPSGAEWVRGRLDAAAPDLIVFCRYSGPHAPAITAWARERGVPTIFHLDDDLLNVPIELGAAKHAMHNHPDRLGTVRHLLDEATLVYCSTRPLLHRLFGEAPPARATAGAVYCAQPVRVEPSAGRSEVVGYMGFDHAHDFELALPALVRLLDARPELPFEMFGSIPIPEALKRFGDRIRTIEPVRDYGGFTETLASLGWTIGICPLAKTPFNEVKADTKWVEYTACGFAVVASQGTVYDRCCAEGCGILAEGEDEWLAAFEHLLDDDAGRLAQVERAQDRLRQDYSPERLRDQIATIFARARALVVEEPAVTPRRDAEPEPSSDLKAEPDPVADLEGEPLPEPDEEPGAEPSPDLELELPSEAEVSPEGEPEATPPADPETAGETEPEAAPPADAAPAVRIVVDELRGDRIWGWAWDATEIDKPDAERAPLELWCGKVRIGTLPRTIVRPDVDAHVGDPIGPKGFLVTGGGLIALWRLLGEVDGMEPGLRLGLAATSLVAGDPAIRDIAPFRSLRHATDPKRWNVVDLWWANPRLLKIRAKPLAKGSSEPPPTALRVMQPVAAPEGGLRLALVDEQPMEAAGGILTTGVLNSLMPIVLVGHDAAGHIAFVDLLPFPSLLRGGLHESERAVMGQEGGTFADLCRLNDAYLAELAGQGANAPSHAVGEIAFDLRKATGAEAIFDPLVRGWLASTLGIPVVGHGADERRTADLGDETFIGFAQSMLADAPIGRHRAGRARLHLSGDAIPTIGAVVSRHWPVPAVPRPGAVVVADEALPDRRWLVSLPDTGPLDGARNTGLDMFPQLGSRDGEADFSGTADDGMTPLAIVFRDLAPWSEARLLYPVPKDVTDIDLPDADPAPGLISVLVVLLRPDIDLTVFLASLASQRVAGGCELLVGAANHQGVEIETLNRTLEAALPGYARTIPVEAGLPTREVVTRLAGEARGGTLVILDPLAVLHDERTLQTLARIAAMPDAGTVGCMLLKSEPRARVGAAFRSAGLFPARVDFALAPHMALDSPNCSAILPDAIYPVAANSDLCWAVSADRWREAQARESEILPFAPAEIDLAIRLAAVGCTNFCTTKVSVLVEEPTGRRPTQDIGVPSHMSLWRMLPALRRSTILRSF